MPKTLICPGAESVAWEEYEDPATLECGQLRIEVEFGAEKHGTAMAYYKGYGLERGTWDFEKLIHIREEAWFDYPIGLGYTQVGKVVEAGGEGLTAVSMTVSDNVVSYYGTPVDIHAYVYGDNIKTAELMVFKEMIG